MHPIKFYGKRSVTLTSSKARASRGVSAPQPGVIPSRAEGVIPSRTDSKSYILHSPNTQRTHPSITYGIQMYGQVRRCLETDHAAFRPTDCDEEFVSTVSHPMLLLPKQEWHPLLQHELASRPNAQLLEWQPIRDTL